jgi:hypothetical protein
MSGYTGNSPTDLVFRVVAQGVDTQTSDAPSMDSPWPKGQPREGSSVDGPFCLTAATSRVGRPDAHHSPTPASDQVLRFCVTHLRNFAVTCDQRDQHCRLARSTEPLGAGLRQWSDRTARWRTHPSLPRVSIACKLAQPLPRVSAAPKTRGRTVPADCNNGVNVAGEPMSTSDPKAEKLPSNRQFGLVFIVFFALLAGVSLWRGGNWYPGLAATSAGVAAVTLLAALSRSLLNRDG